METPEPSANPAEDSIETSSTADEAVTARLHAFSAAPVDEAVATEHRVMMRSAFRPARREKRFGRLAVAAAAVVGFAFGSTGLAMAGALPAPAQDVAHDVLSTVKIEVPESKGRALGKCVSAAARAKDDVAKQACKDNVPPPGKAKADDPGRSDDAPGHERNEECEGRPPWAGNALDADAKAAAKAALAELCGRGVDDDEPEADAESAPAADEASEVDASDVPGDAESDEPDEADESERDPVEHADDNALDGADNAEDQDENRSEIADEALDEDHPPGQG